MKTDIEEIKEAIRNLEEKDKWELADWCRSWNFHKQEARRPKESK